MEVTDGRYCLDFDYHMYGHHMGTLALVQDSEVWLVFGQQGNQWNHARVSLDLKSGFMVSERLIAGMLCQYQLLKLYVKIYIYVNLLQSFSTLVIPGNRYM